MKLTADTGVGNLIRSYKPGELQLSDQILHHAAIVTADNLIPDWNPPPITQLSITDFEKALAFKPEIILFGTGEHQIFPDNELMTSIMRQGVAFEVMDTAAACRTFNVLISEFRQAVAALLIE